MASSLVESDLTAATVLETLERDGALLIPNLVSPETLANMQRAFANRLHHQRWNDVDGYEKTEPYRHMVQDVLTLEQGFVDIALHPLIKTVLREYIGENFCLCEAKGWLSLPTKKDFHGWHGDAWYDQTKVTDWIPRECKLAFYLTDVKSGAFTYVKGSQGKEAPRGYRTSDVASRVDPAQIVEFLAPAGSAVLFDTSGIHRQNMPILEPRHAVFLNYHDPKIPLQQEDLDYYRYHPLLLNAALLGNLDAEDQRILGFGEKTNYRPFFERSTRHRRFHSLITSSYEAQLRLTRLTDRVAARLKRLTGRKS